MKNPKRFSVQYFDGIQEVTRIAVLFGTTEGYIIFDEYPDGEQEQVFVRNGNWFKYFFTLAEARELLDAVDQ